MRHLIPFKVIMVALAAAVLVRFGAAQTAAGEVKLGATYVFQADGVTGDIPISVHLPVAYEKGDAKFPVLYLLDLGDDFVFGSAVADFLARSGRIPSLVVVEVNLDAAQGGLPAMAAFLEKTLFPWAERSFRGESRRVIYGHSGRSFAVLYLLLTRPDLAEAAICPGLALTWPLEEGRLDFYALAQKALAGKASFPKALVFSLGDEKRFFPGIEKFSGILEAEAPADFRWKYLPMPGDGHFSTKLKTLYEGLEFIFMAKPAAAKS